MEEPILRRTWAEIDLDALAHNYQQARRKIGPNVKYLGVVKADAYGHGAIQVSRKLEQLGADYLAVSSLDEAKRTPPGRHSGAHSDPGPHAPGHGAPADRVRHHPGGVRPGQGGGVQRRDRGERRHTEGPHQGGHRHVPAGFPGAGGAL